MKKFISFITGFMLTLAVSVGVYAAEDCSPWAKESIDKAISEGIVPDTLQSDYTSNVTRKEFCRLAVQTYIKKTGYTMQEYLQTPFTDIDDDYVTTAYMLEIVSGKGNEKFDPDSAITRQEAAVMLNNLAEVSGVDNNKTNTEKFVDEDHFANWAKDAIYKISAVKNGGTAVMSGTGSGKFSPWMNYTREQAIATMYRLYGCDSLPVLVPQAENILCFGRSIYNPDKEIIYCIDTAGNSAKEIFSLSGDGRLEIITVSGNKIYYVLHAHADSSKVLYSINTDGTGNTALTPAAYQIYIGHKHIYYVPMDAKNTVICTDLNGKDPVTADFSKSDMSAGLCTIKADKNDTAYILADPAANLDSVEPKHLYEYDFSNSTLKEIPLDTNTVLLQNNVLSDGKYKYYIYRNVYDLGRNQAYNELHMCRFDGSDDKILISDRYADGYGNIAVYDGKVFVPDEVDGKLAVSVYDINGKVTDIYPNSGEPRSETYVIGISKNKIYYSYLTDNYSAPKQNIHTMNIDGSEDTEIYEALIK